MKFSSDAAASRLQDGTDWLFSMAGFREEFLRWKFKDLELGYFFQISDFKSHTSWTETPIAANHEKNVLKLIQNTFIDKIGETYFNNCKDRKIRNSLYRVGDI